MRAEQQAVHGDRTPVTRIRPLDQSPDAAIRAGALLRLGRVLRNTGRIAESRAAFERLAATPGARVAGAPADLVASYHWGVATNLG